VDRGRLALESLWTKASLRITNRGYDVLKKIFFSIVTTSQTLSEAFVHRLSQRKDDLDPPSGPKVAAAQMAAIREWEAFRRERFADLRGIRPAALVVNGVHDELIPVRNSYWLGRQPAERGFCSYIRCWTWFALPVCGLLHQTRDSLFSQSHRSQPSSNPIDHHEKDLVMLVLAIGRSLTRQELANTRGGIATIHAHKTAGLVERAYQRVDGNGVALIWRVGSLAKLASTS